MADTNLSIENLSRNLIGRTLYAKHKSFGKPGSSTEFHYERLGTLAGYNPHGDVFIRCDDKRTMETKPARYCWLVESKDAEAKEPEWGF